MHELFGKYYLNLPASVLHKGNKLFDALKWTSNSVISMKIN